MDDSARTTTNDTANDTTNDTAPWSTRRKLGIVLGAVAVAFAAFLAGSGGDLGRLTGGDDAASDDRDGADGDWERAEIVAVDDDGQVGARVEIAPALDGTGRCVRVLLAGEVGGARCSEAPLNAWDDPAFELRRNEQYFESLVEHAASVDGRWAVALSGAVHPDVVRVTAHFGDGSQYSFVTRNAGGWFVTVLPDDVADPAVADGRLVNAPIRLELFDVEGTRVAVVDLTSGGVAV